MKIVYVITKADEIGGAQTHVRDLAKEFKNEGNEVIIIVGEEGIFTKQLQEISISTIILNDLQRNISIFKDISCAIKLRKLIISLNPDIVALHSSKAGIIGRLSLVATKIPVIFTAHGWAFTDGIPANKKYIYIFIEKIFSRLADKIITVSNKDKELAIKYKVSSENKQIVIHNGIPDSIMQKNNAEKNNYNGFDNNKVQLISIARFSKQKDHITLFHALKKITYKNWHLKLVGKGPLLDEMIVLSNSLGLSNNITFCGEREDIEHLLVTSDIFLLSTNWEGLPISIIEAMRAGLPIISTDVGGVNELISDNNNGYLVKSKDSSQLARKIESLLLSKERRETFGMKSRELFINKFHISSMYIKTKNTYEAVIKEKKC
ncbi:TPA: glycosyltransferase family 4 protein [Providencia alcalifaciens]|uniref:Glycosyltransferase n=1 Tax=Providencia alcalifaciens TaxID=126385 RepID=A0A346CL41_9GAMM|nr:glycosyltransferase family 4 protein [Providencia alcalifaciens]AXL96315.1 glycosyltransferase [Providencia alcalifaciens]CAG9434803.1 D-inositol-3-phosphate glycosyltransferase [Providencia alcalifaciens]